ncbi:unnamed protein product [Dicrocoelium dendriticum]|nr:unnamed protein product [Dicrocoelium dendriticum]
MKVSKNHVKKSAGNRTKKLNRENILKHQLSRLGRAGGLRDLRFGAKDKHKSEDEKALQRHIVERLRQLDDVGFEYDEDDPMNKAAFGGDVIGRATRMRLDEKADGGIQADVVEEQFFGSAQNGNFRDALSTKIAESKLKKLKRVEENEEQRERLKIVDIAWSRNIRFMLEHLSSLKVPMPRGSNRALDNRKSVSQWLEQLTSDRRIPPVDAKPTSTSEEKLLDNLRSTLENRLASSPATESTSRGVDDVDRPAKVVGYLLRVLLRMSEHEEAVVVFVANELRNATFPSLNNVIHNLFLVELLMERFQSKFAVGQKHSIADSYRSTCIRVLCPELVFALTRMFRLASSPVANNSTLPLLIIRGDMATVPLEEYCNLDLKLSDSSAVIPKSRTPLIQLACLHRMLCLSTNLHQALSILLPSCVCSLLFAPMRQLLISLHADRFPAELRVRLTDLLLSMQSLAQMGTPKPLVPKARLAILSSERPEDSRALKKFGLLPQLEPRFEEKLHLRRTKADSKRTLLRKVARERRGAMRELRRDGQSLASHQLKVTKTSDAMRIQKTQAILNSLRTIED